VACNTQPTQKNKKKTKKLVTTGTILKVIDNTGAKYAQCIRILKNRKVAKTGDKIIVAVKKAIPNKRIKTHQIHKAMIVRSSLKARRKEGSYLRWAQAGCILVNKQNAPLGKRILGPVNKDLRTMGHLKVISIATIAI